MTLSDCVGKFWKTSRNSVMCSSPPDCVDHRISFPYFKRYYCVFVKTIYCPTRCMKAVQLFYLSFCIIYYKCTKLQFTHTFTAADAVKIVFLLELSN